MISSIKTTCFLVLIVSVLVCCGCNDCPTTTVTQAPDASNQICDPAQQAYEDALRDEILSKARAERMEAEARADAATSQSTQAKATAAVGIGAAVLFGAKIIFDAFCD